MPVVAYTSFCGCFLTFLGGARSWLSGNLLFTRCLLCLYRLWHRPNSVTRVCEGVLRCLNHFSFPSFFSLSFLAPSLSPLSLHQPLPSSLWKEPPLGPSVLPVLNCLSPAAKAILAHQTFLQEDVWYYQYKWHAHKKVTAVASSKAN